MDAKFTVEFKCNNAAFDPPEPEIARILRKLADKAEQGIIPDCIIMDYNGNAVGSADFYEGD